MLSFILHLPRAAGTRPSIRSTVNYLVTFTHCVLVSDTRPAERSFLIVDMMSCLTSALIERPFRSA